MRTAQEGITFGYPLILNDLTLSQQMFSGYIQTGTPPFSHSQILPDMMHSQVRVAYPLVALHLFSLVGSSAIAIKFR